MAGSLKKWMLAGVTLVAVGLAISAWVYAVRQIGDAPNDDQHGAEAAMRGAASGEPLSADEQHPVFFMRPDGPPRVPTGRTDDLGRSIDVSCTSCHANLEPNFGTRAAADLEDFHTGLTFEHGDLSCLACHNAENYNTLRLSDGRPIEYQRVRTMCAQCHGREAREYEHGAHGGMVGAWDLTRGRRVRKNCIDCHDPHAPAFPRMIPQFKPRDRFLEPSADHD